MDTFEILNSTLVSLFNNILDIEQRALITDDFKDISVTDMHIIEAIGIDTPLTMSEISKSLGVTMGTLSTGINGLVKKGYVIRNRSQKDKRIVYASLTQKGIKAFNHHKKFHEDMVNSIIEEFDEQEAVILTKTFKKLETYFSKWPK
jgi:DNA-binding MarR family transcriptional regulator